MSDHAPVCAPGAAGEDQAGDRACSGHLVVGVPGVGDEHVPRCVGIANGGADSITAACGVTPHAQNTGISPGAIRTASP